MPERCRVHRGAGRAAHPHRAADHRPGPLGQGRRRQDPDRDGQDPVVADGGRAARRALPRRRLRRRRPGRTSSIRACPTTTRSRTQPTRCSRRDYAFHAQQVYAAASRTLATFESALGRRLSWGFNGHHLHLVPHAFAEANAYYSCEDRALLFGYVPAIEGEADLHLPELRRRRARDHARGAGRAARAASSSPGCPTRRRSTRDSPTSSRCCRSSRCDRWSSRRWARPTRTAGSSAARSSPTQLRSGVLTGVAEQIGQVLTQGRGALRRSAMEPPPADWADLPQFQEPHRRGEVLVAVVLDVLIDIWVKRLEPLFSPERDGDGGHARPRPRGRGGRAGRPRSCSPC